MRGRRLTWTIGGIGLIACGVARILLSALLGSPLTSALSVAADILWATSVLVFTIGASSRDSVVARRPLGMIALTLVALWPLALQVIGFLLGPAAAASLIPWAVATFAPLAFALVAVVQIGRIAVAPHPWRWAPAVALAVTLGCAAIGQALFVGADPSTAQQMVGLAQALGVLGFLAHTLGLGIVAILAVASERPASVPIYSSPPEGRT